MEYNFNQLSDANFEHIIQALMQKKFGDRCIVFGNGTDGQRELTYRGNGELLRINLEVDGYWVIQAKYKNITTKKHDYEWVRDQFDIEMKGFEKKKSLGSELPENYLFFTNVKITGVKDTGLRDKIEKHKAKYASLIKNIEILGYDDIKSLLENNRDVATSYSSLILSGDILMYLYDTITERNKMQDKTLHRYILKEFENDLYSRMEQAGQVSDQKVLIDNVFIDLTLKSEKSDQSFKAVEGFINSGNSLKREYDNFSQRKVLSDDFSKTGKFVIKGVAGQGKSTIVQQLCMIYRASFCSRFSSSRTNKVDEYLSRINSLLIPNCARVPIKIELKRLSTWMAKRKSDENAIIDIISFISEEITRIGSGTFDKDTLRNYLSKFSWLFIFDGLDEVPVTANRNEMMDEIKKFIDIELAQANSDAMIIATTRPEGYTDEFNSKDYWHLSVDYFSNDDCNQYVKQLLSVIEPNKNKREEYFQTILDAKKDPNIANLMKTPLQATIMVILVKSGGEPPKDKHGLFSAYFNTMINREKQKSSDTILNSHGDYVEECYYKLGFILQLRSEEQGHTDATISKEELRAYIIDYLKTKLINSNEQKDYAEQILTSMLERVNFATEIQENKIGFTIRSMQEFFAAKHLFFHRSDEELKKIIRGLVESSYWKNTFYFLIEEIIKERRYLSEFIIDTLCCELNAENKSVTEANEYNQVFYGSFVALEILANSLFRLDQLNENKLIKRVMPFLMLMPSIYLNYFLRISDNAKKEFGNIIRDIRAKKQDLTDSQIYVYTLLFEQEIMGFSEEEFNNLYNNSKNNIILINSWLAYNNRVVTNPIIQKLILNVFKSSYNKIDFKSNAEFSFLFNHELTRIQKENFFKCLLQKNYPMRSTPDKTIRSKYTKIFGCDIFVLNDLITKKIRGSSQIKDDLWQKNIWNVDGQKVEIRKLIEKAQEYNVRSLYEIMLCLTKNTYEQYKEFAVVLPEIAIEIDELRLRRFVYNDRILGALYDAYLDDQANFLNSIDTILAKLLKQSNKKLNTVSEYIQILLRDDDDYSRSIFNINSKDYFILKNGLTQELSFDENINNQTAIQQLIKCYVRSFTYICQTSLLNSKSHLSEDMSILINDLDILSRLVDKLKRKNPSSYSEFFCCILFYLKPAYMNQLNAFIHSSPKDFNDALKFMISICENDLTFTAIKNLKIMYDHFQDAVYDELIANIVFEMKTENDIRSDLKYCFHDNMCPKMQLAFNLLFKQDVKIVKELIINYHLEREAMVFIQRNSLINDKIVLLLSDILKHLRQHKEDSGIIKQYETSLLTYIQSKQFNLGSFI